VSQLCICIVIVPGSLNWDGGECVGVDTDSGLDNSGTELSLLATRTDIGKEDRHKLDVKHMILLAHTLRAFRLVHICYRDRIGPEKGSARTKLRVLDSGDGVKARCEDE
jgi:hypothetical protein